MGGMMVAGLRVKEGTLISGSDMKGLAGEGTLMGGMIVSGPMVMGAMLTGFMKKANVVEKRRKAKACRSASEEISAFLILEKENRACCGVVAANPTPPFTDLDPQRSGSLHHPHHTRHRRLLQGRHHLDPAPSRLPCPH